MSRETRTLRRGFSVHQRIASAARSVVLLPLEKRLLMCALLPEEQVASDLGPEFDHPGVAVDSESPSQLMLDSLSLAPNGMPELNSNPNAFAKLFLDFDGGIWSDTWYRPYAIDGDDTTFNAAEQASITEQWQRVSEAFSPFNINVTTVDPGNLNDRETGTIIVAGNAGGGGYGIVGGFFNQWENKGITFTSPGTNPKTAAYIHIHEAGHVLGLWHQSLYNAQGQKLQEYYSGNSLIAPIMGSAYHPQRAIWWNGMSSQGPTIPQDDLAILTGGSNAFGYRPDDHGSEFSLSTPLGSGAVSGSGIIERMSDWDVFSFNAGAGTIDLSATVPTLSPTLDLRLDLYEWDGSGYSNVATASTAAISESLSFATDGGLFALAVRSQGAYGDIGTYTLSGNVPTFSYALDAPIDVSATAVSSSQVQLSWSDESTGESGFRVLRTSDDGETWDDLGLTSADAESFTDTSTVGGEVYHYTVTAEGIAGDSVASQPVRAVTLAGPSNVGVGTISPTKLTLTWTDDVTGETGYLIEKSTDGGSTWIAAAAASPNVTSVNVPSLAISTSYQFRVRASFDGVGYGLPSGEVAATTTFGTPPAAPSTLNLSPSGPFIFILGWTNVDDENGYVIQRSTDGVNWQHLRTLYTNNTYHQDTHNQPGTTFYYRVRSFNDVGSSDWSPVASGTSETLTAPAAPSMLRPYNIQGSSGYLTWSDNSNSEDEFIIEIEITDGEDIYWEEYDRSTGSWYQLVGLSNNASYIFRVSATNPVGTSAPTSPVTVNTGPATPLNFAAARNDPNTVALSWANVAGESEFIVQRSAGTPWDFQTLATVGPDVLSYVDTTATEYESFTYRVVAKNSLNAVSLPSNSVTLATTFAPQSPPTNVTAFPSGKAIAVRVQWDDTVGESEYWIERSLDGDDWESFNGNSANWTTFDDYDVQLGQTYYYRIIAANANGSSAPSMVVSGSPAEVSLPAPPANVRLVSAGTNDLTITWDADPNTVWNVFIERYDPAIDEWIEFYDHDDPEHPTATDLGLTAGTLYSYRIRAYNQAGYSGYSNVLTTSTLTFAPTGLAVTSVNSTSVSLSWNDVAGEESYTIERTINGANDWSSVGSTATDVTTFVDTSVTTNTWYQYRIRANNLGGASAASAAVVTFVPGSVPNTPTGLTITAVQANRVDLQWNDVANETTYRVQRSTDGVNFTQIGTTSANVVTYADTTAAAGTTYHYRVVAANGTGASAPSASVSTTTLPAAPTGLVAVVISATQVNLSWGNVVGETGYVIQRATDGVNYSQVGTTGANVVTFSDTTASAGTTYQYRVLATNGSGTSNPSTSVSATTIPPTPTGLNATVVSATQVNLSWSNVPGETGYTVQRSTDGVNFSQIGTTGANVVTFSDTTAVAGTTYQYRVIATHAAGSSAPSSSVSATTIPAASLLSATAVSSSQINLSWTNVAGETGYVIERSANGTSGWSQIGSTAANVTTFQNTGLQMSTTYFYRVRAVNGSGQSVNSNTASATTLLAAPAAPTNLVATALSQTQIQLTWGDVAGETQYVIERSANGTSGWAQVGTTTANTTTFTNTGLKKNTRYYYRVRAVNSAGNSPYSNVANTTTLR